MTNSKCIFCDELSTSAKLTWDGESSFEGRVSGHGRWNGFAIPAFAREQVQAIIDLTTGVEGCAQLSFVGDTVQVDYPENPDEPDMFEPSECCKTYPVGAWSWTWVEKDDLCECGHYIDNHDVRSATPECPGCDCGK